MTEAKKKLTPISKYGRYGLPEYIAKSFPLPSESLNIGPGDDAAVITEEDGKVVISTDLLLEGTHFNLVYTPLTHLGYKTVVRGISDIFAMGGIPKHIFIGLGVSSRFAAEHIDEFYAGVSKACRKYGCDIAGGDLSASVNGLIISVTATGYVKPGNLLRRKGAIENDLICVTGDLGAAYLGLQLLERERHLFESQKGSQPQLSGYEYLLERELKPEIPVNTLNKLRESGIPVTSMTDICDGLAPSLLSICHASAKGCRIFYDKIPVDDESGKMAEEFGMEPVTAALSGGDDFEFLFTAPVSSFEALQSIPGISIIGHITAESEGYALVLPDQGQVSITSNGWGDGTEEGK
ncbi:MAG TPA: thiamine-phosphate kinase [Bacteroidales bacterium]|nr:thiamine-phosphate kinase [Bacteroidales bacterium]HPT11253.1 thiamine-phosphate kinase [Bacteroidales bacterium]